MSGQIRARGHRRVGFSFRSLQEAKVMVRREGKTCKDFPSHLVGSRDGMGRCYRRSAGDFASLLRAAMKALQALINSWLSLSHPIAYKSDVSRSIPSRMRGGEDQSYCHTVPLRQSLRGRPSTTYKRRFPLERERASLPIIAVRLGTGQQS